MYLQFYIECLQVHRLLDDEVYELKDQNGKIVGKK
jgi:hypothetical protein